MAFNSQAISIRIEPLFWVMAILIGYLNSASVFGTVLWVIVILLSVVIHESGHALTAYLFGQSPRITLMAFGGVTEREGQIPSLWKEFLIVLNGPLAGFMLCGVFYLLIQLPFVLTNPALYYFAEVGVLVNLIWTILNLAPVYPLDGGHLLMIISRGLFGYRGLRIGYVVSLIIAVIGGIGFFLIRSYFAGSIFFLFAFESFKKFQSSAWISEDDENIEFKNASELAVHAYDSNQLDEAEMSFQELIKKVKTGLLHINAVDYLARIYDQKGEPKKAFDLLIAEKNKLNLQQKILLQRLSLQTGQYKEAIQIGANIHQESSIPEIAYINALSHAKINQTRESLGWFETAIQEGLESPEELLNSSGFDTIRNTSEFLAFKRQLSERIET